MTFPYLSAINLIPASGEFVYDTVAYSGMQPGVFDLSRRSTPITRPAERAPT